MFRVNSIAKQLVRFNVVTEGKLQQVDLLPKNFVFTESLTDQIKLLEKEGVIRVKDARTLKSAPVANTASKPEETKSQSQSQPEVEGKLDFVEDDKVAKVQKKKK